MNCGKCGHENKKGAVYCAGCGSLLINICAQCGFINKQEAVFCTECGHSLEGQSETAKLVALARKKDQTAISRLYDLTKKRYQNTCRHILQKTRTSGDMEDVLQDAYIKIFTNLDQLKDPETFPAWGGRIVSNTALDLMRRDTPVLLHEDLEDDSAAYEPVHISPDSAQNPEEKMDRAETSRLVSEMIGELSEEQRLCVYLFYMQEMSVREIASCVGVSENTVKSRLKYGRDNIEKKVLLLEKKGTKLYGLAPMPFFVWMYRHSLIESEAAQVVSGAVKAAVLKQVTGSAKIVGSAAARKGVLRRAASAASKGSAAGETAGAGAAGGGAGFAGSSTGLAGKGAALLGKGLSLAGRGTLIKAAAGIAAAGVAVGGTAAVIRGGSGSDNRKAHAAAQEVLTQYREALRDPEYDPESNYVQFDEANAADTKYPLANTWIVYGTHTGWLDADQTFSYTFFDINQDGTDELLIGMGEDRDHNGVRDDYELSGAAADPSVHGRIYPDAVYFWNGKEMQLLLDYSYRSSMGLYADGTIWKYQAGGAAVGTDIFASIENKKRVATAYYHSDWEDSKTHTINGEAVDEAQFRERLDEEKARLDEIGPLSLDGCEWIPLWEDEPAAGEQKEAASAVETEQAVTETEGDETAGLPELPLVPGTTAVTHDDADEEVTLVTGIAEDLGYEYIGGSWNSFTYTNRDTEQPDGKPAGASGLVYPEGIFGYLFEDLDDDGRQELILPLLEDSDDPDEPLVKVIICEQNGDAWEEVVRETVVYNLQYWADMRCVPFVEVSVVEDQGEKLLYAEYANISVDSIGSKTDRWSAAYRYREHTLEELEQRRAEALRDLPAEMAGQITVPEFVADRISGSEARITYKECLIQWFDQIQLTLCFRDEATDIRFEEYPELAMRYLMAAFMNKDCREFALALVDEDDIPDLVIHNAGDSGRGSIVCYSVNYQDENADRQEDDPQADPYVDIGDGFGWTAGTTRDADGNVMAYSADTMFGTCCYGTSLDSMVRLLYGVDQNEAPSDIDAFDQFDPFAQVNAGYYEKRNTLRKTGIVNENGVVNFLQGLHGIPGEDVYMDLHADHYLKLDREGGKLSEVVRLSAQNGRLQEEEYACDYTPAVVVPDEYGAANRLLDRAEADDIISGWTGSQELLSFDFIPNTVENRLAFILNNPELDVALP